MYNQSALELSKKNISNQISFLLEAYPYIREVKEIDSVKNMKTDYKYGIDAIGIGADGTTYTVQFKTRKTGTDIVLPAEKVTGVATDNGDIGFFYRDSKYIFTPKADIYVVSIGDKHYTFSKEELHSAEIVGKHCLESGLSSIQPKKITKDDGNFFENGEYYAFISPQNLLKLQVYLYRLRNPYLYKQ